MPRFSFFAPLATFCLVLSTSIAIGQTEEPVWQADEIVDSGQIEITSSSGSGALHAPDWAPWASQDQWHVVYAKEGDIYHAVWTTSGWQSPERLTTDAALSKDPKLAFARDRLIVVWEDDRLGHPEIWSREWNGSAWGAEAGLAEDSVPSQAAVITGGGDKGYIAWQEGPDGQTQIVGRQYGSLGWGPLRILSETFTPAIEPSISFDEASDYIIVAWSSAAQGSYQIYTNGYAWGSWGGAESFTDLAGSCRRPSVSAVRCCGDVISPHSLIAFENDMSGVPEVWFGCIDGTWPQVIGRISADDGRASQSPQAHGYALLLMEFMGGMIPRHPVTWTEDAVPGARSHLLGLVPGWDQPLWVDTLSTSGLSASSVAAIEGNPMAELIATWLEEREGTTYLISRRASVLGCQGIEYDLPPSILLTPGGTVGNVLACSSLCADWGPIEGARMVLSFDSDLDSRLTWDAEQVHPQTPAETTDVNGEVDVRIRGGGCSATGTVRLRVNGGQVHYWTGAKSPDINGDCAVRQDDLAYVSSKLGTSDFCADLDGSGSVTDSDVDAVKAALGGLCSQLAGLDEPLDAARRLRIAPNPARGSVAIRIDATGLPGTRLEIFDAAGRLVRSYDMDANNQRMDVITWDGLGRDGRAVASGLYYVRSSHSGGKAARPIVIIR